MATINLHDVSEEIYDAIALPEKECDGVRWKVIETPTDAVTLFEPPLRRAARRAAAHEVAEPAAVPAEAA